METTEERLKRLEKENASIGQEKNEQDATTEHIGDPTAKKRKSPPHTDMAPPSRKARVDGSSLIFKGKLRHFQSGAKSFRKLLQRDGQAYFDRTRYISKLDELSDFILFCRPRRFGKSLTISMLEHFHGLQYADEHQTFYKGLDVQNDIDGKNPEGKKYKPGQYFVLRFDFSTMNASSDLSVANQKVIQWLNSSIEQFYVAYTAYLGEGIADLCQNIDSTSPDISLYKCVSSVQATLLRAREQKNERLTGIQGIYVLVDEYDAFANNYLESNKTTLEGTDVDQTFKSFWSTVKSLSAREWIQKVFITGISPLSLSALGTVFNVTRNLSFHQELAGLCGLTHSDLEDVLREIEDGEAPSRLPEMTKFFNGYHFCRIKKVGTVYNTETCLEFFQSIVDGGDLEIGDPPNSEVSYQFLQKFGTSAPLLADLEKALQCDEKGNFLPLKYDQLKQSFTLRNLDESGTQSHWRSLMVYFGGFTFDRENPTTHLKIPNAVAAQRIAEADNENGRIDLVVTVPGKLIITEWKFYRIDYLDIRGPNNNTKLGAPAKAAILRDYNLSKILQVKFGFWDIYHHQGTVRECAMGEADQLRGYIKSDEVKELVKKGLEMRAYLVIIVGSRHILLWEMNGNGNLANEPRLVGMSTETK